MKPSLFDYLKALRAYGVENNIPNVTEEVGQFLNMLIKIRKPKTILEIGCANGYSTIWMAEAAQKLLAKVHTIDHSAPNFERAKKNIAETGFSDVVEFYFGKAQNIIPQMPDLMQFDFVFVDGEKATYLDFWHLIESRLKPEAVIVFDDMIAFSQKTGAFFEFTKSLKGFDSLLIPMDEKDGILMMIKNTSY